MTNGVSNIFIAIFEGRACLEAWERLDGVIEVSVSKVVGYFDEEFFRAHRSTIKYRSTLNSLIFTMIFRLKLYEFKKGGLFTKEASLMI